MDALAQDFRYAIRHLRHSRGFAAAAILILSLGIGANTAMFSILNGLLLRPLAVDHPDTLVGLTSRSGDGFKRLMLIPVVDELMRDGPFQLLCGINGGGVFAAEVNGTPAQSSIAIVTGGCFDVFGVAPMLGRTIEAEDAPVSGPGRLVAVIGHRFWARLFGADPQAIGKTIRMEGVELTVIGVMPPGFGGLQADAGTDIFVPNYTITPRRPDRPAGASELIGRLKPGIDITAASAEIATRWPALMNAVTPSALTPAERATFIDVTPRLEPMGRGLSFYRDRYGNSIQVVAGLTAALMLLACVNLGGLLLTRLSARTAELRVRLALGSSAWRLAQQMLLESLMLCVIGALVGVPFSWSFVRVLSSFVPNPLIDNTLDFSPDGRVMAATAAIAVVSALIMSALPVWLAWRRRDGAMQWDRTVAGSTSRWARALLVAQVSLSVMLLSGAGLLIRSLYLLQHVDRGVRIERVLNVRIMPLPNAYRTIDNASYYPALLERILAVPGVRSAALSRMFPRVSGDAIGIPIAFVGEPGGNVRAALESASPAFFETVGISLRRGRLPRWTDTARSQPVAIVSESLAARLDPQGDVIGRHVRFGTNRADQDIEIVGVVANASLGNPRQTDFPVFYRPMLQAGLFANYPNLLVATDGDPLASAQAIVAAIKEGHREYAHRVETVARVFASAPSNERMSAALASAVAALALALAFIGVFSVLAYAVSRRTREIGVRVALGADRHAVVQMVMREGLRLTAIGIAIGLPAAAVAGRLLEALLFGVTPRDPIVLALTAAMFVILGIAAGAVPALRAARVDPAVALRAD